MRTLLFSAALAASSAVSALAADIEAKEPFAYATAPTAKAGGAYVPLTNHGPADRLIDVRGDAAKRVEIHTHIKDGDVMKMRKVADGIELPEGGAIEMKPGGYHVMLMGLNAPLVAGETVPVTLVFESGEELTVDVPIVERGEAGHGSGG